MLRRILIFAGFFICLFSFSVVFAQQNAPVIVVIKSSDIEPYKIALNSFKDALAKQAIKAKFLEYDLEGNGSGVKKDQIVREINTNYFDIVLTVGSGATSFAKENFKDKAIVFCMVLNPAASGFINNFQGNSGLSITGAAMDIPIAKQFETIRSTIRGLKRIVAFYNPQETEEVIRRAQKAADSLGISFKAIPISGEKDIIASLSNLNREDALWALADSKVYTPQNTQFIILETLRNGIPFIGLSPSFVKAGALLSFSSNYEENGEQAADLVIKILKGEKPADLPVSTPRRIDLSINANTAEHIKVEVPREILRQAVNIF